MMSGLKKIMVVGDVMLDEYIVGKDYKVSDEAPVPILKVDEFKVYLGGAANVAHNIKTLGGYPILYGVVGGGMAKVKHGHSFRRFMKLLDDLSIDKRGIVCSNGVTTTKSRIIINKQQVARYDYEQNVLDSETCGELYKRINSVDFSSVGLIVVSDYKKGVITPRVMDFLKSQNVPIVVDPKPGNESMYHCVEYMTPNFKEFMLMVNEPYEGFNLEEKCKKFVAEYKLSALVVTMGEKGLYYCSDDKICGYMKERNKELVNIIGAGDTFVSAFAVSLWAGNPLAAALKFANCAAGVVVSKEFTSVCSKRDVKNEL